MAAPTFLDDPGRLWGGATVAGLAERQLVERFILARDEAAFRAIVERHGAMVRAVCRAILPHPADTDDAFQATFLVLVRRRESLRDGDQLGSWLHGVARRVALEARRAAGRRRAVTGAMVAEVGRPDSALLDPERREIRELVHREVDRLRAAERTAVTLCLLEGLTHQEAADQLGWPLGTVKVRVARGRDRLRDRLLRQNPTLTAPAVGVILAGESAARLVVPPALASTTARAAVALLGGRVAATSLISVPVLKLTLGATRAMTLASWKISALTLLAATATVAGAVVAGPLVAQQQPAESKADASPRRIEVKTAAPAPMPDSGTTSITTGMMAGGLPDPGMMAAATPDLPRPESARGGYVQAQIARKAVAAIEARDREGKGQPVPAATRLHWYRLLAEAEFAEAFNNPQQLTAVAAYQKLLRNYADEQAKKVTIDLDKPGSVALNGAAELDREIAAADRWYAAVSNADPKKRPSSPPAILGGGSGADMTATFTRIRPTPADQKRNQTIWAKLEEPISLNFSNETPLSDVLQYVRQSTQDEARGLPNGIPIYADLNSLSDRDVTEATPVAINLEGIPLRTTLQLLLEQKGLGFVVEGGILIIMDRREIEGDDEPATPGGLGGGTGGAQPPPAAKPAGQAAPKAAPKTPSGGGGGGFQ